MLLTRRARQVAAAALPGSRIEATELPGGNNAKQDARYNGEDKSEGIGPDLHDGGIEVQC